MEMWMQSAACLQKEYCDSRKEEEIITAIRHAIET